MQIEGAGVRYLIAAFAVGLVMAPVAQAQIIQQNTEGDANAYISQVDRAISQGKSGVEAALADAADEPELAKELLSRATTTTESAAPPKRQPPAGEVTISSVGPKRCSAGGVSRHVVRLAGVWLATSQIRQVGWCWRKPSIVNSSGWMPRRSAAFPYCWKDTSDGEYWVRRHVPGYVDVRRAVAHGTLGGNTGLGCVGVQQVRPAFDSRGDGSWRAW